MRVAAIIQSAASVLRAAHPDEHRLLAQLLVSRVLECPRLELPLRGNDVPTPEQRARIQDDLVRLATGMPWQYFTGETEFMGRMFACDHRALIPRPETECLVEWFLQDASTWLPQPAPAIADVGVGAGCIVVSIAATLPTAGCVGLDISAAALELARANAVRHAVADRIQFRQSDLLAELPDGSLDAIISNPPYVSTAEYRMLPGHILDFEPALALEAGADGMCVIARLTPQAARALRPGGVFYLECAPARLPQAHALLLAAGFDNITTANDLGGRAHFIRGRKK